MISLALVQTLARMERLVYSLGIPAVRWRDIFCWGDKYYVWDLFQPKTGLFPTRALISVHFKTVHYFSLCIFSFISFKKMHNTIKSLNCVVRYCFLKNIAQLYINFTHSFVAIELLTFCKNAKILFYCLRELSLFWPNK